MGGGQLAPAYGASIRWIARAGYSAAAVEEQIGMVQELAQENGATSFRFASDAEERNALWRARHNAW